MSIEIEHDWQAVFASPKPKIGERAKTRLLLLLCVLWVCFGLVGHSPWKPDELISVSIIKAYQQGADWTVPQLAGEPFLKTPPLYYLSAAWVAEWLSPFLALHDAARLTTGLWVALTLVMVGMTGREMWGLGSGRHAALIFMASIGLVFAAHTVSPEVAGLAACAMMFYGLALAPRRAVRAGWVLGLGLGLGFLAKGLLPVQLGLATALLLPVLFAAWRKTSYALTLLLALLTAVPWVWPWVHSMKQYTPTLFQTWWAAEQVGTSNILHIAQQLTWFAWPSLPLAIFALWRLKPTSPGVQLSLLFFLVTFVFLGLKTDANAIRMLPLLLPLSLLACAIVDMLGRSIASALDWFGVMLFGAFGCLIWLGWFAMVTGLPDQLARQMHKLSPAYVAHFNIGTFLLAALLSLMWVGVVFKTNKRSNRAAVTDWAVGMLMFWGLLMTLWLPWLDAAKSYEAVFADMRRAIPETATCMVSNGVGDAQRAALDYHQNIQLRPSSNAATFDCNLLLVQYERGKTKAEPEADWHLIWEGKRPSDRRERFRLFQRVD